MNILNKTESAVFLYCRFSLYLKDPFFPDYLIGHNARNLVFGGLRTTQIKSDQRLCYCLIGKYKVKFQFSS